MGQRDAPHPNYMKKQSALQQTRRHFNAHPMELKNAPLLMKASTMKRREILPVGLRSGTLFSFFRAAASTTIPLCPSSFDNAAHRVAASMPQASALQHRCLPARHRCPAQMDTAEVGLGCVLLPQGWHVRTPVPQHPYPFYFLLPFPLPFPPPLTPWAAGR